MNEQTDERTNEQMNERLVLALPRVYPAVPRVVPFAVPRKRGRLTNQVLFSTNQKLIPLILRDAIAVLWRTRRSSKHRFVFTNALGPSRSTTNKEATPPGTYLIVSGSDNPDLHGVTFCRAAIVFSPPALVRSCPEEVRKARRRSLSSDGFCL